MRGNNVMAGYFADSDATEQAFRGGWFHSGDLGVWHPDGYIELRDRAKDIIISGGENISTIEVEQAIASHPAVLECAVVAMPHEKWGERPKAFVVLRDGADVESSELVEHVQSRIARFKAPEEIEFVDALPKTSTGKVQKYVLRELAWAGAGAHAHQLVRVAVRGVGARVALPALDQRAVHEEGRPPGDRERDRERAPEEKIAEDPHPSPRARAAAPRCRRSPSSRSRACRRRARCRSPRRARSRRGAAGSGSAGSRRRTRARRRARSTRRRPSPTRSRAPCRGPRRSRSR